MKNELGEVEEVKWITFIGEENFGDGIGYIGWNLDLCSGFPPREHEFEVIGNIYEHSELLKDNNER